MDGLSQAAVWGLAKVLAMEHPEMHCVRIDLQAGGNATDLLAELAQTGEEPLVAYRGGRRYVARLTHLGDRSEQEWVSAGEIKPGAARNH